MDDHRCARGALEHARAQAIVDRKPPDVPTRFRGGTLRIVRYESNRTILDVDSDGWNLLVTSDTHWPGWNARVNGVESDVVTVNGAFNGVFVPPGKGRVELWYWPREVTEGLIAGAVGIAILGFVVAAMESQSRKVSESQRGARTNSLRL